MATYRLGSSSAVNTSGLIAWAINGYAFSKDRKVMLDVICGTFASVPPEAAEQLLSKAIPYTIEGETVVFTVEDAAPVMPQLTCRKCSAQNPVVYFAPVTVDGKGTCICFDCAKARNWLDQNGDLLPGIEL